MKRSVIIIILVISVSFIRGITKVIMVVMGKILIDVPDDVHRSLKSMAADKGIYLKAFLLEVLKNVTKSFA